MSDTPSPTPSAGQPAPAKKRGPGRPPGSKTAPAKKAAARTRKAASRPTGPTAQPAPSPEVDAPPPGPQGLFDLLAGAAVPESERSGAGRPKAVDKMGETLAVFYEAFGQIIALPARYIPGAYRIGAMGDAIVENADTCGLALARWADSSPRIKAALAKGGELSGGLLVVAAHAPIILAPLFAQPRQPAGGIPMGPASDMPNGDAPPAPGAPGMAGDPLAFLAPFVGALFGAQPDQAEEAPIAGGD
jgi:hypothetical protein